jgi:hypothetical protein
MQEEDCALTNFRFEPDLATVFLHDDSLGEGETLPCTLTDFFRREKRIEDPGLDRLGDTPSRVSN